MRSNVVDKHPNRKFSVSVDNLNPNFYIGEHMKNFNMENPQFVQHLPNPSTNAKGSRSLRNSFRNRQSGNRTNDSDKHRPVRKLVQRLRSVPISRRGLNAKRELSLQPHKAHNHGIHEDSATGNDRLRLTSYQSRHGSNSSIGEDSYRSHSASSSILDVSNGDGGNEPNHLQIVSQQSSSDEWSPVVVRRAVVHSVRIIQALAASVINYGAVNRNQDDKAKTYTQGTDSDSAEHQQNYATNNTEGTSTSEYNDSERDKRDKKMNQIFQYVIESPTENTPVENHAEQSQKFARAISPDHTRWEQHTRLERPTSPSHSERGTRVTKYSDSFHVTRSFTVKHRSVTQNNTVIKRGGHSFSRADQMTSKHRDQASYHSLSTPTSPVFGQNMHLRQSQNQRHDPQQGQHQKQQQQHQANQHNKQTCHKPEHKRSLPSQPNIPSSQQRQSEIIRESDKVQHHDSLPTPQLLRQSVSNPFNENIIATNNRWHRNSKRFDRFRSVRAKQQHKKPDQLENGGMMVKKLISSTITAIEALPISSFPSIYIETPSYSDILVIKKALAISRRGNPLEPGVSILAAVFQKEPEIQAIFEQTIMDQAVRIVRNKHKREAAGGASTDSVESRQSPVPTPPKSRLLRRAETSAAFSKSSLMKKPDRKPIIGAPRSILKDRSRFSDTDAVKANDNEEVEVKVSKEETVEELKKTTKDLLNAHHKQFSDLIEVVIDEIRDPDALKVKLIHLGMAHVNRIKKGQMKPEYWDVFKSVLLEKTILKDMALRQTGKYSPLAVWGNVVEFVMTHMKNGYEAGLNDAAQRIQERAEI